MEFIRWENAADTAQVEATAYDDRWKPSTVYGMLRRTAAAHASRPAVSFQLRSGPTDKAETLDWGTFARRVTQAANMFRAMGVEQDTRIAYLLPNSTETVLTLLGGMTAGVVVPVNPLLEPEQISAILRETGAKVLVTLAPFPKTDLAEKAHAAVRHCPAIDTVVEVDLRRYLAPPLSWIVPLIRPKVDRAPRVRIVRFNEELLGHDSEALTFDEGDDRRIAASFHTGGTTGMPKIARHHQRGMVYNGRIPALHVIGTEDVLICPLPLFHVLAAYPILMPCLATGAHFVMPTPAGYRGDGVMDNFWKLIERWGVTMMVMVPTAASALMQRKVNADVSSLKWAICGSAPLPVGLFNRFEEATGVRILEGYGMTEATCLVSINPPFGERKVGSVGLPIPYTKVKILDCGPDGAILAEKGVDEVGEICVRSPGIFAGYSDERRNAGLFAGDERWLRTGDLGRIDADGYVWITGRAKDLIIRGGHNIDPAIIEEALMLHPDVAFAGAIGQPDRKAGEVPCVYVELNDGATAHEEDLLAHAREHVPEKAAVPRRVEVLDELPKTAVGKVFKPALRKRAIARVYRKALADEGISAEIGVVDDSKLGLVAEVKAKDGTDPARIGNVLDAFARPWRMSPED